MAEEKNNFKQLCVWPGCVLGEQTEEDFKKFMLDAFKVKVKFEQEVETLPDKDDNENPIPDTGGRHDLFFYVHNDDSMKFTVPRLKIGIRWWEDVIMDNSRLIYPQEILDKYPNTWNGTKDSKGKLCKQ